MTLDDFHKSLTATQPPADLTLALAGLWWDAKGDWTQAHESAQQDEGPEGSWVHAYLHRKEGDPDFRPTTLILIWRYRDKRSLRVSFELDTMPPCGTPSSC